jgi:hypothetical protein
MPEPRLVYVIDDEEAVRDSMVLVLESRGRCTKLRIGCGIPQSGVLSAFRVRRHRHAKRISPFWKPNVAGCLSVGPNVRKGCAPWQGGAFQWVQIPPGEFAPAGSNRSSHGGNEMAEAFD